MTSKLTIEQAKRLRNDFECWQQDYDPKDDKEQYDMFGRGMAAMDMLIAGMYQEPVAYAVSNDFWNRGNHQRLIDGKKCDLFFPGEVHHGEKFEPDDYDYVFPLYRHAQPAPVVPDAYVRDEHGRMMLNGVCEPKIGFGAGWNACRAAMLQAGNSPVIPEGYVMLPKEMTDEVGEAIAMQANCCGGIALDIYDAMLSAADCSIPMISDRWIPVSERMPDVGQKVLVYRPKAHKDGDPSVSITVYATYRFQHGFGCYWEPSHWMPLPASPQEVNHG